MERVNSAIAPPVISRRSGIQTWNYKTQDSSIKHIGPTAQDFYGAFGLGESDKTISTVDASGIALRSIQALYQMNLERNKRRQG